jgi:quercetin dioxygenase-like cupin family protein
MHRLTLGVSYEDKRGKIKDLIVSEIDSVTHITFTAGAIRGNHFHKYTTQWVFVVNGKVEGLTKVNERVVFEVFSAGDFFVSYPNEAHAFKALEPCEILVFTKGPRSGGDYNLDTFPEKLI